MKRPRLRRADEYDTVCARSWYAYLMKAGVTDAIKRRIRRRERQIGKRELEKEKIN